MSPAGRKFPAPLPNPETRPFWEAATEGRLLLKRCRSCGETHYYPRSLCPFCGSGETEWLTASGGGTIYAYSVMRRAEAPFAIAYVTLDEGVTMMTNLVDCDLDGIRIGQRVRLVFMPSDGGPPVPAFTPA